MESRRPRTAHRLPCARSDRTLKLPDDRASDPRSGTSSVVSLALQRVAVEEIVHGGHLAFFRFAAASFS